VDPDGYQFLSLGRVVLLQVVVVIVNRLDSVPNFNQTSTTRRPGLNLDNLTYLWDLRICFVRFGEELMNSKIQEMDYDRSLIGIEYYANWSSRKIINNEPKAFMLQFMVLELMRGVMGCLNV